MADLAAGRKRLQITLGERTVERLDEYCANTGMSRSAYIEYVIASGLDSAMQMQAAVNAALVAKAMEEGAK